MAQNKGAIVRYRAIDRCLWSKHGKYGIEELRAACAEALYDASAQTLLRHQKPLKKYHYFQDFLNADNRSKTAIHKSKTVVFVSKCLKIIENLQNFKKIFARFRFFVYLCSRYM